MALLNIFANFFIDTNERYLRMMDSLHSFKDINAEKWIINARGKFAKDTMSFLRDQLGTHLIAHQRHSKEGWFHDTRQMLPDIDGDYILFWLEDHINLAEINVLDKIVLEMKEKDLEYMTHTWWHKGRLRERYRGVPLTNGCYLDYFEHNVTNNPTIQSNVGGSYLISAASISKLSLFNKIVLADDPIPRRWPIETPFDFEKAPNDTHWLPIKVGLPRQELFASIDCDHDCEGYSLQSRGLYPIREGRKSYADQRTWEGEHVELSQEIKSSMTDITPHISHNNNNEYLPFMDENEIKAICCCFKIFHKPINVLEWGSGDSTTYFARYLPEGSEWHSIEHNSKWAEYVKSLVDHSEVANVHLHYVPYIGEYQEGTPDDGSFEVFRDYVLFPLELKKRFHIIIVDGRARIYCMKVGWQLLDNDGVMILHDAQRKQYNSGIPNDCFWLRIAKLDVNYGKVSTIFIAKSHAVINAIRLSIVGVLSDYVEMFSNLFESCDMEAYEAIGNFTEQQDEGLISAGDIKIPQHVVVGSIGEEGRQGFSHADTNGASERGESGTQLEVQGTFPAEIGAIGPDAASVLFLTTYYAAFMASFYRKNPNLGRENYEEQKAALLNGLFGDSDYYSKGLEKTGWKADDIIINCAPLQQAWARENGVAENNLEIAVEQIRSTRPQVVYLHDLGVATEVFISAIRPFTDLIVGQIASPVPAQTHINAFDIFFSSFPHFVERFRKSGIPSYYQPLAFDPRILEKVRGLERTYPVTFVGGISSLHGKGEEIIEKLAELIPIDFWGYGAGSLPDNSPILKRHHGEAWGLDMFSLLRRSKITINRHIDVAENYANNMRLFEATGCGALLITDHKDNLNELFEIGKEVISYRSPEECAELVKYYMANPKEAEEIARAGQARTLRDHTYTKRMEQTAEILERHLRYRREKDRFPAPDMSKISYGHTLIEHTQVSEDMTLAWKNENIPERQRSLVQKELQGMYKGIIPPNFRALQESLRPYVFPGCSVLEIGCASGYYYEILEYLLNKRISYTGVDYSESLISMAKDYYPKTRFYVADGANLPFGNEEFFVAISSCILLHVPNWPEHIRETIRVSSQFVVAHRTPICRRRPTQYMKKFAYGVGTCELTFNEKEIVSEFEANGLKLVRSHEYFSNSDQDYFEVTYLFVKEPSVGKPIPKKEIKAKLEVVKSSAKANNLKMLNLGCGGHYHSDWINIDFRSTGPGVHGHNLLKGIPASDNSVDVVYHANLLEHFTKRLAPLFIKECYRVLKPKGIIRVAVPDLENVARLYIELLEKSLSGDVEAQVGYEWIMIELFDQMVRNQSGGEMFEYWKKSPMPAEDFVVDRCGPEVATVFKQIRDKGIHKVPYDDVYLRAARDNDEASLKKMTLFRAFSGEVHQWMYDRYSLMKLLQEAGFVDPNKCQADESGIPHFNSYLLDMYQNGRERKPASLYMEARKLDNRNREKNEL